jgi:glycosyltransferase involved in cell wall biosynthesis
MIRVDLHMHSRHSRHPSEWFLQRLGAQESYTDVEDAYRMAKARGMTHVTLTDHNTIEGARELHERHPADTFISSEITSYFPENGCKVHVLVYDITPAQFEAITQHRENIYQLRDYLRAEGVACSVAHATYSVNDRLTVETLEKLVLLFDVFEGINGGRDLTHNRIWTDALAALTPAKLAELQIRHGVEPWGRESWRKGLTAGSDDHAGLAIGQTFTEASGETLHDLLDRIRGKATQPAGRHADHRSLSCAVYKIAHEFSRSRQTGGKDKPWDLLNALLFDQGRLGLRHWFAVQKVKRGRRSSERVFAQCVEDLLDGRSQDPLDTDARIARMYGALSGLSDGFFTLMADSLAEDLQKGETGRLLGNISAALPALFLLTPFLTVMRHMHGDRDFLRRVSTAFRSARAEPRRILWFSDTVLELNGVAVTMREIAARAHATGRSVKLTTCLADHEDRSALPPGVLLLPCIYDATPDFYSAWTLRLPSPLRALDLIARESPDAIVISTPGPVGLIGLAAARLLRLPCTGIYHTDFTRQVDQFIGDPAVSSLVETYTRAFFSLMDDIRVPTERYMAMLKERGLAESKMKLFQRGIESSFAAADPERQDRWRRQLGLTPDLSVLLWAGRMGREKNLDFLLRIFRQVAERRADVRLVLAGDGPEAERLRAECREEPRIIFTGRLDRADLPTLYSLADILVFPSTTDTFGMVVLEAQACGLPALVSDIGGPQELVASGETGFVVPADDLAAWTAAVLGLLDLKTHDPEVLARMRAAARARGQNGHGWDQVLDDMLEPHGPADTARPTVPKPEAEILMQA